MAKNQTSTAPIWMISRHRLNTDGQGVTTLVVFYGCHLNCAYCINPITKFRNTEESTVETSAEELYKHVKIDNLYFAETNGGITFGGGEPLLRHEFIRQFASLCAHDRWNLRVETSLNVHKEAIESIIDIIDHWFIDIKDISSAIYNNYTGCDNTLVINNLKWFSEQGVCNKVTIRLPLIAGFNDATSIKESKDFLSSLGFSSFDELTYLTSDQIEHKKQVKRPQRGKTICNSLKAVRCRIAEKYHVAYIPHECSHKGPCLGTCPRCEHEVAELEKLISRNSGLAQ